LATRRPWQRNPSEPELESDDRISRALRRRAGGKAPLWWPESWSIDELNDEIRGADEWPDEDDGLRQ